ncbi:MAG: hypothetical protein ACYS8Z_26060 [Planctomycetota bacterium]
MNRDLRNRTLRWRQAGDGGIELRGLGIAFGWGAVILGSSGWE